ncbi:MAG: hypothetical protein K2P98_03625 [Neisseriaceae bacterium]|nr:hypothetical protein [Neisseriaceae bacterium]
MSKYILMIIDAMSEVFTGYDVPKPALKHKIKMKPSSFKDDALALQSDWNRIGGDFRKSVDALIKNHGN